MARSLPGELASGEQGDGRGPARRPAPWRRSSWRSTASPGSPRSRRCSTPQGKPVGATVALASLDRELAAYRQIQNVLLGAGLAAVLLAPLLSFFFTRQGPRARAPPGGRGRDGAPGGLRREDRLRPHGRGGAARPCLRRAAGRPAREAGHGGLRHRAFPQPARAGAGAGPPGRGAEPRGAAPGHRAAAVRPLLRQRSQGRPGAPGRGPGAGDLGGGQGARAGRGRLRPPGARPLRGAGARVPGALGGRAGARRLGRADGGHRATAATARTCRWRP